MPQTIAQESEATLNIERSRFIAKSFRVTSPQEARKVLKEMVREFPDATHHCFAWRIGAEKVEEFASDAGEPPGSAGRPILGAIKKYQLTNTMVVVVRYFGGKKLGVKGLIKAYGEAAQLVLAKSGTQEFKPQIHFAFEVDPVYFNLFIARLQSVVGNEGTMDIDSKLLKVSLTLPSKKEEKIAEFIGKAQKEGWLSSFYAKND
ncbi:IMPACT family protein [Atrimonas thermophila]|uniref:IMPACT family protein n=1 Tax=Atrimonas thermophila TaxID=3064161 RepID=UPI00399C58BD